jgi:hypothetical protein
LPYLKYLCLALLSFEETSGIEKLYVLPSIFFILHRSFT